MRLTVRLTVSIAAATALALGAATCAQAQSSSSSTPASTAPQPTAAQAAVANGGYISTDPLANVRYDNRFDLSLGMAYDHMKAGPTLLQGSNLGGLDISGSYWLTRHWGIEATDRTYVGTSGAGVNSANIKGPFVAEYFFTGGPEYLGPHNKHGAIILHAMGGGVYGDFTKDLLGHPASFVDFYNNQFAPAAIIGGHFDLNRSEHWVFRITPDAVFTWYSIDYYPHTTQMDVNFAISVGAEYKFTKHKR
jgi:hypothetical protein